MLPTMKAAFFTVDFLKATPPMPRSLYFAIFRLLIFALFFSFAPNSEATASAPESLQNGTLALQQIASNPDEDDEEDKDGHESHDDDGDDDDHYGGHKKKKLFVREKNRLKLGTIASSITGPGTATLSPQGILSTTGDVFIMSNRVQAARFIVKGPRNKNVIITLPTSVTVSNGSSTTTLTNFQSIPSGVVNLGNNGRLVIKVGATMNIPPGLPRGSYYGPFTIYVDLM